MIYKTKKKFEGHKAKDFCNLWSNKYYKKYKKRFLINWVKDTATFHKLLSLYASKNLIKLVHFAFSERKETSFLRNTGYNIAAFVSQINFYTSSMQKDIGGGEDAYNAIPYYEVEKFTSLVSLIRHSELEYLIKNLSIKEFGSLWLELRNQAVLAGDNRFVKKMDLMYKAWNRKELFLRRRIKKV